MTLVCLLCSGCLIQANSTGRDACLVGITRQLCCPAPPPQKHTLPAKLKQHALLRHTPSCRSHTQHPTNTRTHTTHRASLCTSGTGRGSRSGCHHMHAMHSTTSTAPKTQAQNIHMPTNATCHHTARVCTHSVLGHPASLTAKAHCQAQRVAQHSLCLRWLAAAQPQGGLFSPGHSSCTSKRTKPRPSLAPGANAHTHTHHRPPYLGPLSCTAD